MTDTRKKLINILSKYMDKTLSEGCLVEVSDCADGCCGNMGIMRVNYSFMGDVTEEGFTHKQSGIYQHIDIIGHYDITAVLKYIENVSGCDDLEVTLRFEALEIGNRFGIEDYSPYGNIPNKPLHLYTEQEDKLLLELLQKLG